MNGDALCFQSTTIAPVFQDLRQEETLLQIALTLDHLDKVSSDILNHIKSHIENQTKKLVKLQQRSSVVEAKVHKISGSNKATKVFSSAKYPGSEVRDFECELQFSCRKDPDEQIKVKSKHLPLESFELKDKLQFFHIKYGNKLLRKNAEVTPEEGLGVLPNDLDSVSSLLLFNTSENLYKQYVMLDPLGVVTRTRQVLDDEEKIEIVAAPLSMSQRDQSEHTAGFNYFYSPKLQEIPQLDVPLDLPDLPGIAGDLQYLVDSGPPIAPSVISTPDVTSDTSPAPIISNLPLPTPSSPPPSLPVQLPQAPPPPPPPPPPILPELISAEPEVKPTPPPPQVSAPLPHVIEEPPLPKVAGDARSTLMEAIRNAGGTSKLRSVVDRKQEAKRMKQEEESKKPAGGVNWMADLHATLAMRRKGISGSKVDGAPSTMERVLAMIEPPSMKESETEDEGEWEEE